MFEPRKSITKPPVEIPAGFVPLATIAHAVNRSAIETRNTFIHEWHTAKKAVQDEHDAWWIDPSVTDAVKPAEVKLCHCKFCVANRKLEEILTNMIARKPIDVLELVTSLKRSMELCAEACTTLKNEAKPGDANHSSPADND
jgi:hypothetical protein